MKSRNLPQQADLLRDEHATVFPSLGYFDARRGQWRLMVHGRAFHEAPVPFSKRLLLRGLKRAMHATAADLETELFRTRIGGFLAKPVAGKRIILDVAGKEFCLRKRTRRNGSFYTSLKVSEALVESILRNNAGKSGQLPVRLIRNSAAGAEHARFDEGTIHVVRPEGLSIVSDIDDTIKNTEATCRQEMLTNTFLRPFKAVEGMAGVYAQWNAQGADFHYVSSSPWELYESIADLCRIGQFPAGSMHLRYFRIRDEMFKRWRPLRRKGKAGIIASLMVQLPMRRFVLIGDSGERDPEIYRFLAKRFPNQVAGIFIRELPSKPLDNRRLRKLESIASSIRIEVFRSASELAQLDMHRLYRP